MEILKKRITFPFLDKSNIAVFSCCHVIDDKRPILYVSHDNDGYWQFLCGDKHTIKQAKLVSLYFVYENDNTVGQIANLDYGCYAIRKEVGGEWKIC